MCAGCIGIQRRVQTQGIVSATILVQFLAPLETDVSAKKHDIHDILEQDCKLARAAAAFLLEFVGQLHVQIEGLALRHDDRRIACTQGYAMAPTLCELFRELAHDGLAALCEVAEKQSLGFAALVVVDGLRRDLQDELSTCHDDGHRSAPFANGSIHAPEHVAGGACPVLFWLGGTEKEWATRFENYNGGVRFSTPPKKNDANARLGASSRVGFVPARAHS